MITIEAVKYWPFIDNRYLKTNIHFKLSVCVCVVSILYTWFYISLEIGQTYS